MSVFSALTFYVQILGVFFFWLDFEVKAEFPCFFFFWVILFGFRGKYVNIYGVYIYKNSEFERQVTKVVFSPFLNFSFGHMDAGKI